MVEKILFITLSNIGDVILTLPVLDALRENFPQAKITVMVGPRPKEIFEDNPKIDNLIIFDKYSSLRNKIKLFNQLKKERFDCIVDLRNSFFGALLPAQYKTSSLTFIPKDILHMKDRHLYRVQSLKLKVKNLKADSIFIKDKDEEYINSILRKVDPGDKDKIIVISAGARSHIKRWPQDKFVELIKSLVDEFGAKIILVGDKGDLAIAQYIVDNSGYPLLNLCTKTSLTQLAYLLKKALCTITNDSAVLHLASYLDVPVVSIFGPTNESKYGPWSKISSVVKKDIFCRACEKAQCVFGTLRCMQLIKVDDILRKVRDILNPESRIQNAELKSFFNRILIVRTDRIGDVLLSTPVISNLRDSYPSAYIAMMVSPYAKDVVEGNPYLDEAIIYDKDVLHRSWFNSVKFSCNLKKKKFDLAIILHPTNRVHLVTFFAGIPKRVGFNRKLGFLLTDRIEHTKQYGQKHELEYNLDLLRYLGIRPEHKEVFMPIKPESERWVDELFKQEGIKTNDKLLAVHPGASCLSKIWPNERFAQVADKLAEKYGFKVLVVSGPKDISLAENVFRHIHHPVINLAGRTSVSQLASLLKRCQLFVSNDSGPVHIASGVGVPVVSIFGRSQKGLGPKRWGPVGIKDRFLHKSVGCIECLAHNCVREFACLKALSVDDVLAAADSILGAEGK